MRFFAPVAFLGLLLCSPAFAVATSGGALGFDTAGSGATDREQLACTAECTTQCSYFAQFYAISAGGGSVGRVWYKIHSTRTDNFSFDSASTVMYYAKGWSTSTSNYAKWQVPAPTLGAWHDVIVTYDATSTSNTPSIYIDGVSKTVTTIQAPSGSLVTGTGPYYVGNNDTSGNPWDGGIARVAMWQSKILSAQEVSALHNGAYPGDIERATSSCFYDNAGGTNIGDSSHLNLGAATITNTLPFKGPQLRQPFPFSQMSGD